MYYTVIKQCSSHLRTLEKCRKHPPAAYKTRKLLHISEKGAKIAKKMIILKKLFTQNSNQNTPFCL